MNELSSDLPEQSGSIPQGGEAHSFHGSFYMGPYPSPENLKKYAELDPDLPNRIFSMAEAEMKHRHECEEKAMQINSKHNADELKADVANEKLVRAYESRGQIFALMISLTGLAVNAWLGYLRMHVAAGSIGVASILGLGLPVISAQLLPDIAKNVRV